LTTRRHRYHPARYMKGPPQVYPRSVRGRLKLAPTSWVYPWPVVAFCSPSADRARLACCPAWSVQAIPRYQQRSRDCPGIPRVMRGPDSRPASDLPEAWRVLDRGRRAIEIKGQGSSGNRPLPASPPRAVRPNAPPGRVHDRGRCPLYVRAQLETAGLPWTQWDLAAQKATARETGNSQLTGRFRR
jgi:hypothetical protein